jgi:hypothetical protein
VRALAHSTTQQNTTRVSAYACERAAAALGSHETQIKDPAVGVGPTLVRGGPTMPIATIWPLLCRDLCEKIQHQTVVRSRVPFMVVFSPPEPERMPNNKRHPGHAHTTHQESLGKSAVPERRIGTLGITHQSQPSQSCSPLSPQRPPVLNQSERLSPRFQSQRNEISTRMPLSQ